jgi:hypothetical protein
MLPVQDDIREKALEIDEVDRAVSDHLVGESAVAVPRIAGLRLGSDAAVDWKRSAW